MGARGQHRLQGDASRGCGRGGLQVPRTQRPSHTRGPGADPAALVLTARQGPRCEDRPRLCPTATHQETGERAGLVGLAGSAAAWRSRQTSTTLKFILLQKPSNTQKRVSDLKVLGEPRAQVLALHAGAAAVGLVGPAAGLGAGAGAGLSLDLLHS